MLTPSMAMADTGYMPSPLKLAAVAVVLCAFAAPAQAKPASSNSSYAMTPRASWIAIPAREPLFARTLPHGGHTAMVLWKNLYSNAPTPTSLLVLGSETGPSGRVWLKLLLPKRPNGSVGWVPADELTLHQTTWRVEISTTRRVGVVFHRGHVVKRFPVIVGCELDADAARAGGSPGPAEAGEPERVLRAVDPCADGTIERLPGVPGRTRDDRDPRRRRGQPARPRDLARLHPGQSRTRRVARPAPGAGNADRDRRLTDAVIASGASGGRPERGAAARAPRRCTRRSRPAPAPASAGPSRPWRASDRRSRRSSRARSSAA